jgi:hypothetical protein
MEKAKHQRFTAAGDCTPRVENRSEAIKLVESLIQNVNYLYRKDYFLCRGLEALREAMERKVI